MLTSYGVMESRILFHGSNREVSKPRNSSKWLLQKFGYGFYAKILKSRQRDGLCQKNGMPVVNQYSYLPDASLNVLIFEEMTEKWLDFIADCRRGIEHSYDIVEGPMADDQIWNYVEDFVTGKSSRAAFWELAKFSYPTHQIVFCTQRSLKNLKFEGSVRYYAK